MGIFHNWDDDIRARASAFLHRKNTRTDQSKSPTQTSSLISQPSRPIWFVQLATHKDVFKTTRRAPLFEVLDVILAAKSPCRATVSSLQLLRVCNSHTVIVKAPRRTGTKRGEPVRHTGAFVSPLFLRFFRMFDCARLRLREAAS